MTLAAPELAILRWLASHARATASEIAVACAMALIAVRARVAMLERMRLVAGRQDTRMAPAHRVFWVTLKGLRAARVREARPNSAGNGPGTAG